MVYQLELWEDHEERTSQRVLSREGLILRQELEMRAQISVSKKGGDSRPRRSDKQISRCGALQHRKARDPVQLSPSTLRQQGSVPQGAWAKVKLPKAMTNVKYSLKLHDLTHLWNIEK